MDDVAGAAQDGPPGAPRTIYFGPKAQEVLAPMLKLDRAAPIFSPADAHAWRNERHAIKLGDDITVAVCDIRADRVRIGTVAPKELPVHRPEVYDAIRGEHRRGKATKANHETLWHQGAMVEVFRKDGGWRAEVRGTSFYAVAPDRDRVVAAARLHIETLALVPAGEGA